MVAEAQGVDKTRGVLDFTVEADDGGFAICLDGVATSCKCNHASRQEFAEFRSKRMNLGLQIVDKTARPGVREYGGDGELAFLYSASQNELVSTMVDSAENLTQSAAERVLDMITIEPDKIRRLLGKSTTEDDVPIWEHNKRSHRYMIRPLIKDRDGRLIWGAASVDRSRRVWQQTLSNGYLPAEFDWPAVRSVVRDVKQAQEKELEAVAAGIASRHTPYFLKGIDFKDRYSNKGFEDVGDFDVLAYWPNKGAWLAIECKYNQPAFCLKDARRLRDRMFGDTHRRGQLFKIHRRQSFLEGNLELLRELLGWPSAIADKAPTVFSAYVSREIHWWMRSPPYPVSCNFVRVDALDDFLSSTWPATDVRRPPG